MITDERNIRLFQKVKFCDHVWSSTDITFWKSSKYDIAKQNGKSSIYQILKTPDFRLRVLLSNRLKRDHRALLLNIMVNFKSKYDMATQNSKSSIYLILKTPDYRLRMLISRRPNVITELYFLKKSDISFIRYHLLVSSGVACLCLPLF
jgi:hypothetical protein